MQPAQNITKGGHEAMNSSTGLPLTRSHIRSVPLTQFVKNAVEALAHEQGHTRLKFTNKKGIKLGNSDWITGVDHDNSCQNNNNNDEDSDDDNSNDKSHTPPSMK